MKVNIIGKLEITYENGITQFKNLISQEDYESKVKSILNAIYELESERSKLGRNNKRYSEIGNEMGSMKSCLSELGEYVTSQSPLGLAYRCRDYKNLKLPKNQGGAAHIDVKLI